MEALVNGSNTVFDKKFVFAASLIALIYVCIVIAVNNLCGKESAGVAGVGLTALSTAMFKQFEKLRFNEIVDSPITITYVFSWWKVLIFAFFFAGLNLYLQDVKDYVLPSIGTISILNSSVSNLPEWSDIGVIMFNTKYIAVKNYSIWEIATECVAFFVSGLIIARSWTKISYSIILVASLLGVLLDFIREQLLSYFFNFSTLEKLAVGLEDYQYSFLYVIFAFIGFYLIRRNVKSQV